MTNSEADIFKNFSLDRKSPVPIYYQIQKLIREMIDKNKIKQGAQLPTEEELCSIFNISRMTVRQVYNDLLRMELISREKGKGTFVSSNKVMFELSRLQSFTEDMKKRNLRVKNKILEKKKIKPHIELKRLLKLGPKDEILRIKRLRYVENIPMAIETSHVPLNLCPGLDEMVLLQGSLFKTLEKKFSLAIDHSDQALEPIQASQEETSLLKISPGSPLIRMTGITYLKNNSPVEYIIGIYRGDRYKFKLTLKR